MLLRKNPLMHSLRQRFQVTRLPFPQVAKHFEIVCSNFYLTYFEIEQLLNCAFTEQFQNYGNVLNDARKNYDEGRFPNFLLIEQ